jgi:hypothetical protein
MTEFLNTFGVIIAIGISITSFLMNWSRSKHQNRMDTSQYAKNLAETAGIATAGRLDAETRSATLEKRISDLEKMLNAMAYRVTFVVHTGEEPRIEKLFVERFPNRRFANEPVKIERRKMDD